MTRITEMVARLVVSVSGVTFRGVSVSPMDGMSTRPVITTPSTKPRALPLTLLVQNGTLGNTAPNAEPRPFPIDHKD